MTRTGIFFHYQRANRLADFPAPALAGILERENVIYHDAKYDLADGLYYSKPVSEELLSEVHSSAMIERVKSTGI